MKQLTAKTVEDVLRWVETTPHHHGSWIDEPGFFILRGHGHRLRIPEAVHAKTYKLITAGGRTDARMYRATKAGRARLRRAERNAAEQALPPKASRTAKL